MILYFLWLDLFGILLFKLFVFCVRLLSLENFERNDIDLIGLFILVYFGKTNFFFFWGIFCFCFICVFFFFDFNFDFDLPFDFIFVKVLFDEEESILENVGIFSSSGNTSFLSFSYFSFFIFFELNKLFWFYYFLCVKTYIIFHIIF